MTGGAETNGLLSRSITQLSVRDRNATILWVVVTIGLIILAGLMAFYLVGIFTIFPYGVIMPLLILIPLILYMISQSDSETPELSGTTTVLVLLWFFSMSLLVAPLGLILSSVSIALIVFVLGFALPLYYLRNIKGLSLSAIGFTLGSKRNIIVTVVLTLVYGVLVFVQIGYWEWTRFIVLVDFIPGTDPFALIPLAFLFGILFSFLAAALPEELVFRTVLQSYLSQRSGRLMGILIASLIFGFAHVPTNIAAYQSYYGIYVLTPEIIGFALAQSFLFQAQIGLIFGVAWERTRSLLLPVMLHSIHNAVELLPYFLGLMLGFF
ncbi:MAG: CPBP family intramembrane glutamic endopeptidase [Candidatus Thorarchaeota archaeon]|jgi:membrane protease YdiL (CAAX protease family)